MLRINYSDNNNNDNNDISNLDVKILSDLGIVAGTEIESLYKSPFGNPAAYLIRGTVFALRNETAEKIIMETQMQTEKI